MSSHVNLKIGLSSLVFMLIGSVLSTFRGPLFGITEGYAPNELVFSSYVFFPILLISFALGTFAFIRELSFLNKIHFKGAKWQRYLTLVVSLPSIILGLTGIVAICIFMTS